MRVITVSIQIGNSDDKLSQQEWSSFVMATNMVVSKYGMEKHFFGSSDSFAVWQNAAWIFNMDEEDMSNLRKEIKAVRERYRQDSVAITFGITSFV